MSTLELNEKSGKICDVYFAYVKIKNPGNKYQSEEKEYSVQVVVDKDTAKSMKKAFKKNGVKTVDREEFEERFKFEPPFEGDELFVLNFKSPTHYKDGKEKPYEYTSRPKIYEPIEEGKVKDITMDSRVGNGSMGDVAFTVSESPQYGMFHNLTGILVKEMVELEERNTNPFGEVEDVEEDSEMDMEDVPF